jgi:hypothetical protein
MRPRAPGQRRRIRCARRAPGARTPPSADRLSPRPLEGETGSAAGPLVSRLVAQGLVRDGATVVVEQGHAMGRPRRIRVLVSGERVASAAPASSSRKARSPSRPWPTAPSMHDDRGRSR